MRPSHHGGAPAAASPAPPRATSAESVPLLCQTPNRDISPTGAKVGAPEQQFETLEFPPRCNAARSWVGAKPIGTRRAGGEESIPATNPPKNRARSITPCKKILRRDPSLKLCFTKARLLGQSSRKYKAGPTGAVGCGTRRGKHRHSGEAAASLDEKGKLGQPQSCLWSPGGKCLPCQAKCQ